MAFENGYLHEANCIDCRWLRQLRPLNTEVATRSRRSFE